MHPLLGAFESMMTLPILATQSAITQMTRSYQEQMATWTGLVESFVATSALGGGVQMPKDEDLFVGKTLAITKTMTDIDTLFFGMVSQDYNPLHFNEALAQKTRFQRRITHGVHTASLFSGVLSKLTPWCAYLHQDMDFVAPVYPGDLITATGTIEEISVKGSVQVALDCRNQRGEVVVRGKAVVKKLREMYQPPAN